MPTLQRRQGEPGTRSRTPKPYMRQTRSHSVPLSDRVELPTSAQPALSGPPEVFGNERLQALFAAVDQVSRSTASASQTASLTDSGGKPVLACPNCSRLKLVVMVFLLACTATSGLTKIGADCCVQVKMIEDSTILQVFMDWH